MCFDILYFFCMNGCCKYTFYSKLRVFSILKKLDKKYLSTLRSDKIPISDPYSWKPHVAQSKYLQYSLKHNLHDSLKTLNIPVSSLGKYFAEYLDIQLAYFIFEIIINTYLDIEEQQDIKSIPLLDISIPSVFYYVPKYDKKKIDILQQNFYKVKGKKIDMNTKISGMDKILLDLKLEIMIEDILKNIDLTFFIEKIYHEHNIQLIELKKESSNKYTKLTELKKELNEKYIEEFKNYI